MFIAHNHNSVRLTGRFYHENNAVCTTACGSYIDIAFSGDYIILHFDMQDLKVTYPLIYLQLDEGDFIGTSVAARIFLRTKSKENHTLRIILQSVVEFQSRWFAPVEAKIAFEGYEAENYGTLNPPIQKTITFIGDSITEGILIHPEEKPFDDKMMDRVYQDDVTRTYAWQIAKHFNLRATFCGYGGVGFLRSGSGQVPKVNEMYDYCVDSVKWEEPYEPDYIMINHGCNDRGKDVSDYLQEYEIFLNHLVAKYKNTKLIILSPFVGAFHKELDDFVKRYNAANHTDIFYIDSSGWVEPKPVHPLVDGHRTIAENVIDILEKAEISYF